MGNKEEAERIYAKLTARNPDAEVAWFRLGLSRLERGDHRGSAEAFLSAVQKRAEWPEAQRNLGIACWNIRDLDGAMKAFEAVLALDPDSIDAVRALAALAVERNDFDQALQYQAQLIEKGDRTPELFYNTGVLLQKAGQLDDAARLYREALDEREQFPEALLNLGHVLKDQGKQDEARDCWKKALEQKPEIAGAYFGK
jgi:tetratricopeptide (TPR) repeat protein